MDNVCSIVGKNIKRYRLAKGYTQEKLAVRAKVGEYYLGRVERGQENISVRTLQKIAVVLKVNIRDLFDINSGTQ